MSDEEFQKLVKPNKFQVFLLTSFIQRLPIKLFVHSWIVTVRDGKINRWEVWDEKNNCPTSWGHVHKNLFSPWEGRPKFSAKNRELFKAKLVGLIEGEHGSLAERMANFIETQSKKYDHMHRYNYYVGPNCNSFTQWVLRKFPEARIKLPLAAYGKWYR